jgi:hypothetical protein
LKKQKALTDLCAKIKTLPLIKLIKLIFTDKEGGLVSRMIGPASVFLSGIDLVEVLPPATRSCTLFTCTRPALNGSISENQCDQFNQR